jgi:hypothetical protein
LVSSLSLFPALHINNSMSVLSACFQNGEKSRLVQVPRNEGVTFPFFGTEPWIGIGESLTSDRYRVAE